MEPLCPFSSREDILRTGLAMAAIHQQDLQLEIATANLLIIQRRRRRKKSTKRLWVRDWILRRPQFGVYENLLKELKREDIPAFRNFLRMDGDTFDALLARLEGRLTKQDTFYRKALPPGLKLAITLRFLATGDSYMSLQYSFRVAHNTITSIVDDTCAAIIDEFMQEVMPCPSSEEDWKMVATGFAERWNFHNTVGALDGKHIRMKCPDHGGSTYYNYKGYHSIVLLALVDADYKFLYVDVGASGAGSDAGIFAVTPLRTYLEEGTLSLPPPTPLPGNDRPVPYFIVGDDAFPLRNWLMKPFPHRGLDRKRRIYNYRLSRARRIVENAFGVLTNRWRCLLTTLAITPKRIESVVIACCILHNMLRMRGTPIPMCLVDTEDQGTHLVQPGLWREGPVLDDQQRLQGRNTSTREAKEQREYLADYYNSPAGAVSWQDNIVI